jgi:hypothetical protein
MRKVAIMVPVRKLAMTRREEEEEDEGRRGGQA